MKIYPTTAAVGFKARAELRSELNTFYISGSQKRSRRALTPRPQDEKDKTRSGARIVRSAGARARRVAPALHHLGARAREPCEWHQSLEVPHHGRQDWGLLCKSDIRLGDSGGNVHVRPSQSECVRGRQQVGGGEIGDWDRWQPQHGGKRLNSFLEDYVID